MRFHTRAFVSFFLATTFGALVLSGVTLFVAPRCRIADETGWTVMSLGKDQWESIHINLVVFFLLAVIAHLILNWQVLWTYVKKKGSAAVNRKLELLAAVLLATLVLVGCIFAWPPFQSMLQLHDHIKDSWGRPFEARPGSDSKDPTLHELSEQMGLETEQILQVLKAENLTSPTPDATLREIAEANHMRPADIRAAIRDHFPDATLDNQATLGSGQGGAGRGLGGGRGPGGSGQGHGMGRGQGRDPQPQE